ncbi:MAG: ribosomal RNA small subunit methyltransferase A [Armatimonadetes bacterium]|nr:ribosomal RNA small subunit methyltransferase A [Armatimonadota bacterium]
MPGSNDERQYTQEARAMWDEPLGRRTRSLAAQYGIRPSKRLGQSFLVNERAAKALAEIVAEGNPPGVVEIGGGLGALSVELAQRLPRARLTIYELDAQLCQVLTDLLSPVARRCWVICSDFLRCSWEDMEADDRWALVGNLPYSMTTPILEHIFAGPLRWSHVVVMVQREFAERMMAGPGSRTYGALSLFAQLHCESIERVMDLAPGSFWPRPQVASVALRLKLRRQPPPSVRSPSAFTAVVRAAFGYRRKTLLRGLATAGIFGAGEEQIRHALEQAGLDPGQRAETVDLEGFARLAEALATAVDSAGETQTGEGEGAD